MSARARTREKVRQWSDAPPCGTWDTASHGASSRDSAESIARIRAHRPRCRVCDQGRHDSPAVQVERGRRGKVLHKAVVRVLFAKPGWRCRSRSPGFGWSELMRFDEHELMPIEGGAGETFGDGSPRLRLRRRRSHTRCRLPPVSVERGKNGV
ncbi:hypothetical protein BJV77DRAFT_53356 [Russula vinacea]|jgi:hypothetical protein|nr:hypothetical protein BJV77DRAFT_53356 [Russula vinacea]